MNSETPLYNLQPTTTQICTASVLGLLFLVWFLATIPLRNLPLASFNTFIAAFDTAQFLGALVLATLLFAEALVLRSKALIALGTGFYFTAIMIIPHGLSIPVAYSFGGFAGAGVNTTAWLYLFWHCGLPLSVIAYTLLKTSPVWPHTAWLSPSKAIFICLISATILVGALTLLATIGEPLLPRIGAIVSPSLEKFVYVTTPAILLLSAAIVIVWRGQISVLDVWLSLILWTSILEFLLSVAAPSPFSVGWYCGRIIGLLSGLYVLLMLLAHTSKLYAQAVLQAKATSREGGNQLMIRDAIAASIAHELRQPLGAIMLNAQAAQRHVPKPDDYLSAILNDILDDSSRASDIVESTREIFGKSSTQKTSANVNQLVWNTLAMASRDLRDRSVSVNLQLGDLLPPIDANRIEMQQVLFNLITNASEAMSTITDRDRILTIRSDCDDTGLLISVEDTGPGIRTADEEKIFETFYTTKSHGLGLGLSISRSIITAHRGELRVASLPIGAAFEIRLPHGAGGEAAN